MRKGLILSIFLLLGFFCLAENSKAEIPKVVINEVQITGGTGKSNDDFIELYNTSDKPIDITDWKLEKIIKSGTKSIIKNFEAPLNQKIIIPSGGYFLWACSDGAFKNITLSEFTSSAILSNDYSIALLDKENIIIDALAYGTGHAITHNPSILFFSNPVANTSLERNLNTNTFYIQTNPSPKNNSFMEEEIIEDEDEKNPEEPKKINNLEIRINEVFPNPSTKGEDNEFIEIFNYGDDPVNISNFTLKDASKSSHYAFPEDTFINSGKFIVVYKETSRISLNNTDEKIYLLDENDKLIDFLEYSETKEESSYGFDENENKFRWSKNITPGEINIFDPAPDGKGRIPKKSYKNFPTEFSANGSSNYDYSWDFGDGGRSTKQKTTHTYKKTGKFNGFLIIDNGTEEKKIDFEIKIEKYPKKSLNIIGILSNPEGSDSDNEYIIIENNEKKSIDLSNWSIATGSNKNKLTNHPFTKSIVIKKGETKIIYNKYSNFSLPNQKGFIELRQPDEKVADKISYSKEKSIGENELYKLGIDKKWTWENQPLVAKNESEDKGDESKEELKFENLSQEEKEKITQEIKDNLREEIYNEIVVGLEKKSEENQSVLGEENKNEALEEETNFVLELKKSMKNIFISASLYLEELFK